nr:alpha/beta hydrolase [Actinoallomurus iriomotensis]
MKKVTAPTLILDCAEDMIAPPEVGTYVHQAIPGSRRITLDATGHCPQLSAPEATIEAIAAFARAPR